MKAEVKSALSADVDVDVYVPDDPEKDGVWVRLLVGPLGESGEESFDVLVCTPLWLRDVIAREGPQIGRHHLIVDPFDLPKAVEYLRRKVASEEAGDWSSLGERLGRIGYWEFEDYKECKG